jgi:hypothetical protein
VRSVQQQTAHLLVEGKNDLHVIAALCQYHHVLESFDIIPPEDSTLKTYGIDALLQLFYLKLRESHKRAVGIVLDADQNINQRWEQVKAKIQGTNWGYTLPAMPEPTGTILVPPDSRRPRIGVWIMPDNQNLGMLEDFAAYLIPPENDLRPFASKILGEIETTNQNRYLPIHHSKAFIHTWLAWQETPGMPMGQAITAKTLSADSPTAHTFVNWLNQLFNS